MVVSILFGFRLFDLSQSACAKSQISLSFLQELHYMFLSPAGESRQVLHLFSQQSSQQQNLPSLDAAALICHVFCDHFSSLQKQTFSLMYFCRVNVTHYFSSTVMPSSALSLSSSVQWINCKPNSCTTVVCGCRACSL